MGKTLLKVVGGCVLLPFLLVGSCTGKMSYDAWRYQLPGEVLQSSVPPTQALQTPFQVASVLDSYVQPRFEILRDRNFGAMRIVYRKHAGLVQLKVDTAEEKEKIANVNAAQRDYAISLLHCAKVPERNNNNNNPRMQVLYVNQEPVANSWAFYAETSNKGMAKSLGFDAETVEKKAIAALPKLMRGEEQRTEDAHWSVLMRPVLAARQECLNCHTESKRGDTLGVMVYAVRKSKKNAPSIHHVSRSGNP